jgi:hypothetical protein
MVKVRVGVFLTIRCGVYHNIIYIINIVVIILIICIIYSMATERQTHRQVAISGGLLVDEHIAPLVDVLRRFEKVQTVDSCEGYDDAPCYVYFTYQGDAQAFMLFVNELSIKLRARLDSCCDYKLRMEWLAGSESPMAELISRRGYVNTLADALQAITTCHTNQSDDGR